jgi:hypothetical protein
LIEDTDCKSGTYELFAVTVEATILLTLNSKKEEIVDWVPG